MCLFVALSAPEDANQQIGKREEQSIEEFYPINGAPQRIGISDTAFSFREANFAEVILGVDPDPANNERMNGWAFW